ncbi:MAG: T9SS type A sorting domain-containing protein [Bacteroidia bacterium]
MKRIFTKTKHLLIASSTFFAFSIQAQPVINYGNMPVGMNFNLYSLGGISGSSLSPSGPGVTWNISTAVSSLVGTADFLDMSSTPYATAYPAANFAIRFTPTSGTSVYSLFNLTSTVWEEVANNVGSGSATSFIDYRTALVYPFTFGLSNTDSYQKSGQAVKSITHNYDSYGTLITSFGTTTNVVRDFINDDGNNSALWFNTSGSYVYPLLQADASGVTYWQFTSVNDIQSNDKSALIHIYPNPAQNTVTIFNKVPVNKTDIYDVNGQLKIKGGQSSVIDISDLSAGVYILKAETSEGMIIKKIVKE